MPICINRKPGQAIVAGDVRIEVSETHRSYVVLRIHAPRGVPVLRAELGEPRPRTGNPSPVVAASAPAAGAVCEPPPSAGAGGAAGTQGGPPRRRVPSPPPSAKDAKTRPHRPFVGREREEDRERPERDPTGGDTGPGDSSRAPPNRRRS
jgi:sRNA-binding carbon storage regulator CsrA